MEIIVLAAIFAVLAKFFENESTLKSMETFSLIEEWGELEGSPALDSIGRTETINFWLNYGKALDKSR